MIITRTWTAVDACTNTTSATSTVTVRDTIPPVLVGLPANVTVQWRERRDVTAHRDGDG